MAVANEQEFEDEPTEQDSGQASLLKPCAALSLIAVLALGIHFGLPLASAILASRPALESAIWIYRHDPVRRRAIVCCLFHVTVAIWHAAPSAMATLIALLFIGNLVAQPIQADAAVSTLTAMFSAIGVSALLGMLSALAAVATKSKIWVHPHFYTALSDELKTGDNRRANHGYFVLATSLTMPVLAILAFVLRHERQLQGPMNMVFAVLLLAGPILGVVLPLTWLSKRIFANGPRDYLLGFRNCRYLGPAIGVE